MLKLVDPGVAGGLAPEPDLFEVTPPDPGIAPLVERLAAAPGVEAVILLGSAARGELAKARVDGRVELFSDLEFMAVTAGRLPARIRRDVYADVERIAAGFGHASPLFHVDVLFRERRRLGTLPPFIFTYELAATGRTVHGPDLRREIRRVGLANLDRRNTHEILMKRLWAIAEALPAAFVRGDPLDPLAARTLGVVLHRNPLDVTTVLLPEVGVLLPSYAARVHHWADHPELPFRTAIDAALRQDSGAYLEHCLAERALAAPAADAISAYRDALMLICTAQEWLETGGTSGKPRGLFNERPVTPGEGLAMLRQIVRIAYSSGISAAARWAGGSRKAGLSAGLVSLHGALVLRQAGDEAGAQAALDHAVERLAPVACAPAPHLLACAADTPFAARWMAVRALAGRAFWRTVRLGDPAAWARIVRTIGWEEGRPGHGGGHDEGHDGTQDGA